VVPQIEDSDEDQEYTVNEEKNGIHGMNKYLEENKGTSFTLMQQNTFNQLKAKCQCKPLIKTSNHKTDQNKN